MQILVRERPQSKEVEGEVLDSLIILGFQHVVLLPIELCPTSDNVTPPDIHVQRDNHPSSLKYLTLPYDYPRASPARNNLRRSLFPVKGQAIISRFPGEIAATGIRGAYCLCPHYYMDICNSTNSSSMSDAPVCYKSQRNPFVHVRSCLHGMSAQSFKVHLAKADSQPMPFLSLSSVWIQSRCIPTQKLRM